MKIRLILSVLLCFFLCNAVSAKDQIESVSDLRIIEIDYTKLPPRAKEHIPALLEQRDIYWPDLSYPSILAAQIEQETCITLTHKMCWNPAAELKTSREHGIGLGQVTRAWDTKGNIRFDVLEDLRKTHKEALDGWSWKNAINATYQLRALILMDKGIYNAMDFAETAIDRHAFTLAAYNGGIGGVSQDRAICRHTKGCNPNVWFGNVEHTSRKAKATHSGYSKSFFQINREYVRNIIHIRHPRYLNAGLE